MNLQLEHDITRELRPEERLLWTGQPATGIRLEAADAIIIPFSLLWTGLAVSWEAGVISQGAPLFFALFGAPFVLAGAYITVGRFLFDAYRRSRLAYAVTTQRIIFVRTLRGRTVESLDLGSLTRITVHEHRDRSATIAFGPTPGVFPWFAGAGWASLARYAPPRFERVRNGREVYDRIMRAKDSLVAAQLQR